MTRRSACLLAAALLAGPVAAQETPSACVADEMAFAPLLASLEAEGWQAVAPGAPLPDAAAERIALARTVFYATTDRGGADLPAIMALQRRAVGGYPRRVDTEQSRLRVLTRGEDAMTLNWTQPQQGRLGIVEVICRIATTRGEPAAGTAEGFGPTEIETIEAPLRRVTTVALEPALLKELSDASATTIIETVSVLGGDDQ